MRPKVWNQFQHTGTVAAKPRSGRLRSNMVCQDRYLVNMAKRQRFHSAVRLNTDFQTETRMRVTPETVRNRFHAAYLLAFRPAVHPIFTSRHIQMSRAFFSSFFLLVEFNGS
jgi:hypothetical protein